jgi:peptidoglycan/LPS O-acetylase OafA/YrhL
MSGQMHDAVSEKTETIAPKQAFYRPELDALRFVGFLGIFLGHAHPFGRGLFTGIDSRPILRAFLYIVSYSESAALPLFFLLSAYVITTLLMREKERKGTIDMRAFYIRRVLRLWPLYLTFLFAAFIGARFVDHDHRVGLFVADLLLVGNFAHLMNLVVRTPIGIDHLWSISVEEQFYLLFPSSAKYLSRRNLTIVCSITIAVGLAVLLFINQQPAETWRNSLTQFIFFAVGVLLGLRYPANGLPKWSGTRRWLTALAGIFLIVAVRSGDYFGWFYDFNHFNWAIISTYVGFAIGLSAIFLSLLGIRRSPPRLIVFMGKITYGLYVFHLLGQQLSTNVFRSLPPVGFGPSLARDTLALAITIGFAVTSYYVLELPFLKLKDKFTVISSRPA